MSRRLTRSLTAAAILAAAVSFVLPTSPVGAHDGGPRLILEPNEVNPGGVVLIRGEDLGLDEAMQVSLVGDAGRADLAAVTTDGQGHFTVAVEIPPDVPVGTYAIQSATSTGAIIRSLVRVDGAPIVEQGGAPPGQDEGFPAPQPGTAGSPAAAPVVPEASSKPVTAAGGSGLRPLSDPTGTSGSIDIVPFVALGGALAALAFLVLRTRRRPVARTGSADLP